MKPVAIFRHAVLEGPGYLAEFLDARAIPWRLIAIDANEAVPQSISAYSGLVFMGGPMSVNDDLPWIEQELKLIREAAAKNLPMLGHCLGGQLISSALGGVVSKNPVKEIGWGRVQVADNEAAHRWFGDLKTFEAFHWHGETFALPEGAVHLLSSEHCVNQGYAIGPHLALQCHIEMTAEMISGWCAVGTDEIAAAIDSPAVQTAEEMRQQATLKLPQLHAVAERLYTQWISRRAAGKMKMSDSLSGYSAY
jgi:GMP synthase-like glutamine amidotransferase